MHRIILLAITALGVAAPAASAETRAKPKCVVPRLTGDTLAMARGRLAAAHCTLGTVREPEARKGQTMIVAATNPKAGMHEKNKARVSVTLKIKQSIVVVAPTQTTPTPTTTTPTMTTPTPTTPSLIATTTVVATSIGTVPYGADWFMIGLDGYTETNGAQVDASVPLTYTVTDITSGTTIGSFVEAQNTACSLIETAIGNNEFTLQGYSCPSSFSVTINGTDEYRITGTFPGDSMYATSTSAQAVV